MWHRSATAPLPLEGRVAAAGWGLFLLPLSWVTFERKPPTTNSRTSVSDEPRQPRTYAFPSSSEAFTPPKPKALTMA